MKKLAVRTSGTSPSVYIGTMTSSDAEFRPEAERTDEVLLSVADLVTYHYGGDFTAKYTAGDGSEELTISVQVVRRPK